MTMDVNPLIRHDVSLAPRTYFGIGGPAKLYAEPRNDAELAALLRKFKKDGERIYILGGGTNLLVSDKGVNGAVIRLTNAYEFCEFVPDSTRVRIGAAHSLAGLVHKSVQRGLAGVEGLGGIPGTFGGAAFMNAGGRHGNIGDVITSLALMDWDGNVHILARDQLRFEYRNSNLDGVVLRAELEMTKGDPEALAAQMKEVLHKKQESQPMSAKSAGCVFKNPPGGAAGALIDQVGLKGRTVGGAQVSTQHANFIINTGGARAADVLELIRMVQEKVKSEKGICLELEIKLWGFD